MLKKINVKDELDKVRKSGESYELDAVVGQAIDVLLDDICREREIRNFLSEKSQSEIQLPDVNSIDEKNLYSKEDIRKVAIRYRLRFLDSEKFKPEIPHEAIAKVKALEKRTSEKFQKFKILAPSEMFVLEDCDKDPVLFAELNDGRYFLIHQWGSDMAWWRSLIHFPLRNFKTLGLTIFTISLLLSLLVPTDFIVSGEIANSGMVRFAFFAWSFVCITAIVTYIGFAFFKSLSTSQWNSPFFKHSF